MNTDTLLIQSYEREIHDLRVLLVLMMHIRAGGFADPNDKDGWDMTQFDELSADWDDLASSLSKQQWLTGVRAFDHVESLDNDDPAVSRESKTQLNKLYRGYKSMKCTSFSPPRMMSKRLLSNGLAHIKNEFRTETHGATRGG